MEEVYQSLIMCSKNDFEELLSSEVQSLPPPHYDKNRFNLVDTPSHRDFTMEGNTLTNPG
jgi:translation elongation factor EF-G